MDFTRACTFDDLLAANQRYLRGEIEETPYSVGPLASETAPLLAGLLALHAPHRRLLTFESQPGLVVVRRVDPWESEATGRSGGGGLVETQQRAYVDCFVEARRLPALLARLSAHAAHICFSVDVPGRPDLFYRCGVPAPAVWLDSAGLPRLNLTRERRAPDKAALRVTPWVLHTNARLHPGWADEEAAVLAQGCPRLAAMLAGCALLGVMARWYGPAAEGCPTPLQALLESAGPAAEPDGPAVW